MEQQGTVNNRTFVLLNFRSTILAPTIHQLKDHQITNISKNIETPLKIPISFINISTNPFNNQQHVFSHLIEPPQNSKGSLLKPLI